MLDELANCALCLGWDPSALASVGRIVSLREWRVGDTLFKQGEAPTGALALLEGEGDVVRLLPGGGELPLATLHAGDIVGELGLISTLPRSATVRARSNVRALFLDRARYEGALHFCDPAVLKLTRNILLRIARLTRHARQQLGKETLPSPPVATVSSDTVTRFDYESFLPLLPAFRPFLALDWTPLLTQLRARSLAPTTLVNSLGAAANGITFVVRGALEAHHPSDYSLGPLQVFGPGAICGLVSALDQETELLAVSAREESVVLHLMQTEFNVLLARDDPLGVAMIESVSHALSDNFTRLNSRIAQITGIQRAHDISALC